MKFINIISATLSLLGFSKAATIPTAELVKRTARTSTPSGCKTVTSKSGVSLTGKVYLGRPWRAYSRVIYQNSVLTDVVNAKGWTTLWAGATPIYEEYNNSGDGSDTSDRLYLTAATGPVSKDTLYGSGWKDWIDTSY